MNNFKSCVPCVCTGSGDKRVCERHNIGTQTGPLPQTQQLKQLKTLRPQTFSKISKILKNP